MAMPKAALLVVVALVAMAALPSTVGNTAFTFTEDEIASEEAMWELFGRWAAYHDVVREPGRFATFKANIWWRRDKQLRSGSGRPMALNGFGDRSFHDFAAQPPCAHCADDSCAPEQETGSLDLQLLAAKRNLATKLPSRVDWRDSSDQRDDAECC